MSTDESARLRLDEIEARYSDESVQVGQVWRAYSDVPALTAALREVLAARPNHAPSCRCGACSQHTRTVRAITAHIDVEGAS